MNPGIALWVPDLLAITTASSGEMGRQVIGGARLAHPERAALACLRSHVPVARPAAPDCDVDAVAEVSAGVAAAGMVDGRVEGRGLEHPGDRDRSDAVRATTVAATRAAPTEGH